MCQHCWQPTKQHFVFKCSRHFLHSTLDPRSCAHNTPLALLTSAFYLILSGGPRSPILRVICPIQAHINATTPKRTNGRTYTGTVRSRYVAGPIVCPNLRHTTSRRPPCLTVLYRWMWLAIDDLISKAGVCFWKLERYGWRRGGVVKFKTAVVSSVVKNLRVRKQALTNHSRWQTATIHFMSPWAPHPAHPDKETRRPSDTLNICQTMGTTFITCFFFLCVSRYSFSFLYLLHQCRYH